MSDHHEEYKVHETEPAQTESTAGNTGPPIKVDKDGFDLANKAVNITKKTFREDEDGI